MFVIIISGNPKYIKNSLAKNYYREIEEYLKSKGVDRVEFDPGEPYTCPDMNADFYIAHSRGVSREVCFKGKEKQRFLKFGAVEGYIHPVDKRWQESGDLKDGPPKEHFVFTKEQKEAIDSMIDKLSKSHSTFSKESFPPSSGW